jgi:hypothetical protein
MRRSGHGSGGGHGMNKVSHRSAPKAEPKPHSIDPAAVHQIGTSQFLGRDALRDGKGYSPPQGPTDNVAAVGVGGGRTVMRSGSQGTHGPVDRGMPSGMGSTKGEWPD